MKCWVQIHGLPLGIMCEQNASNSGGRVGKVIEVEPVKMESRGKRIFLRVSIEMSIDKPLVGGVWPQRIAHEAT